MAVRNYSNTAVTTALSGGVSSGATTVSVDSTTGFPSVPFYLVIDRTTPSEEVVYVTAVSGSSLTVTRGADSSVASAHDLGAAVEHAIVAADVREPNAHIAASADVHGLTGGDTVLGAAALATHATTAAGVHGVSGGDTVAGAASVAAVAGDLAGHEAEVSGAHGTGTLRVAAYLPGEIKMYAGAMAPSLWVKCEGAQLNRTTYAALFAAIGTTYGAGDGSTTFNVPNFTGRVPMGGGTLGATGGADSDSITLSTTNLPSHTHSINHDHPAATTGTDSHSHSYQGSRDDGAQYGTIRSGDADTQTTTSGAISSDAHSHSFNVPPYSGTSGSTGSGSAFTVDTVPSHQRVNFIIYAGV